MVTESDDITCGQADEAATQDGPWIVHHRDGWCALPPGAEPDPEALNDPTLCGHVITMRWGTKRGKPDCPECVALLGGTKDGGDTDGNS